MAGGMPNGTMTISAQTYPFLSAYEDQQMAPPAQHFHHGLPVSYPSQHQAVPYGYQDRHAETGYDASPWTWHNMAGQNAAGGDVHA